MKKSDIQKWCNALRSGKYKQGRGALQTRKGYCCIGVACDLFTPHENKDLNLDGTLSGTLACDQEGAPKWIDELSDDFMEQTWFELEHLNDSGLYSFNEIADLLEAVYVHEVLS